MVGRDTPGEEVALLLVVMMVVTGARTEVMDMPVLMVNLEVEDPDKTSLLSACKSSASLPGAEDRIPMSVVVEVEVSWWTVLVPRTPRILDRAMAEEAEDAHTLAETLGTASSFWR